MSNYPMGVKDSDFHIPNAHGAKGRVRILPTPLTTMVYCPPCMKHWEAPARADYWNARVELCPIHANQKRTLFNIVELALGSLGTLILFTFNILPRGTR